jgi:hypothetical protein
VLDLLGRGAVPRLVARLARIDRSEPLLGELGANGTAADRAGSPVGSEHKRPQRRIHRQLELGNVSKASKVLDEAPMAVPNYEVLAVLCALHTTENPPRLPEATTLHATITADVLSTVLKAVPRGSTARPSGWTYEHVYAAIRGCPDAEVAVLDFEAAIVRGKMPQVPALLAANLLPITKAQGGTRLIAVGEVWCTGWRACVCSPHARRWAPVSRLSTAEARGTELHLAAGVLGGAQITGHAPQRRISS